jgi:mannose-1-phosphate guanylyltransferase
MTRRVALTIVVMAGGKGERLWPLVRRRLPKVALSLDGERTLLGATIDRLRPLWPGAEWLIVTTAEQGTAVRAALPRALRRHVLVEPQIRNTAACIALAAAALAARNPHQVLVMVPADHWIGDAEAFRQSLRAGIRAAVAHDAIAMVGIRPTGAHPGFGYLSAGHPVASGGGPRTFTLQRFVEKPTPSRAARLLRRGRTYWNSGIFIGTADKFLECITEWLPGHTRQLVPVAMRTRGRPTTAQLRAAYRRLSPVSFDHGVMDHVQDGLVVEGRFRWADLGSWDVWARHSGARAWTVPVASRGVHVVSPAGHVIATIGVRDLLIVHTPTATLICPPGRAQDVREVVRRLEQAPQFEAFR